MEFSRTKLAQNVNLPQMCPTMPFRQESGLSPQ